MHAHVRARAHTHTHTHTHSLSKGWQLACGLVQRNKGKGEKGLEVLKAEGEGSGRDWQSLGCQLEEMGIPLEGIKEPWEVFD